MMFFIFGTPRSGTTLLAQSLAAHPDIVVPHETDFIVPMAFICDRVRNADTGRRLVLEVILNSSAFADSLGEYLTPDGVSRIVATVDYRPDAIVDGLYARIAQITGARLAGDKSPNDLNFIRILDKTGLLDAPRKVLHIVRDVRDVMVSLNRTGWASEPDRYFARQWCNNNLYLHAALRDHDDRYLLLRYEDLVVRPAAELSRVCEWLDVPYLPNLLEPDGRAHKRYRHMDFHRNLTRPITTDSVGRHRAVLDSRLRDEYERQAGEALRTFGYL